VGRDGRRGGVKGWGGKVKWEREWVSDGRKAREGN